MNSLAHDYKSILFASHDSPCMSLYQPTHRQHPDNAQDPIRFGNLLKQMEESLRQKYPKRDIQALLKPFKALAENKAFWNHTGDGIAVLSAPGLFRVYNLQRPVAELVVVADSLHTKPLMRIAQSADRYQVLALSLDEFKVYEGNRDALDEILSIEGVAQTADELIGKKADEREGSHRTYGRSGAAPRHGTDVKQDAADRDSDAFFRKVDQLVLQHCSQPSGTRLILAALPEHHNRFRSISRNPFLMKEALDVHPDAVSLDVLRERAWQLVQPYYIERLEGLLELFGEAASKGQGSDDLGAIAKAAISGRIATLLIEADRLIPGSIDDASGKIILGDIDHPEVDDVLDDLGERVLRKGGEVIIVPAERMPTKTGAAAIYRF